MNKETKERMVKVLRHRATIATASVLLLYTLVGFFLVPFLIAHFAPKALSDRFQSEVTLDKVSLNPYALTAEVRGFRVSRPDGEPLLGFDRLHVNFQLSSLFRWALTFRDVILDNAFLNIVVDNEGNLNLERLAGPGSSDEPEPEKEDAEKGPRRMLFYNVEINDARVEVTDTRQPVPATASFHPLTVHLADVSTLPDREGRYSLSATSGDGAAFDWTGSVTLHPFSSKGELAFRDIPLETPWSFCRSMLGLLPPVGKATLETGYLVDLGRNGTTAVLDDLRLGVEEVVLQLEDEDEPLLTLPSTSLDAESVDLARRRIKGVALAVNGGMLGLVSNPQGVFNLQKIVRGTKDEKPLPTENAAEAGEPWTIDISGVSLKGIDLDVKDQTLSPARTASIAGIDLGFRAEITTSSPQPDLRIDELVLGLERVALGFDGEERPALNMDRVSASGGSVDLGGRSARLTRLEAGSGVLDVIRQTNGTLNLSRLFDASGFTGDTDVQKESTREKAAPWDIYLEAFELRDFAAHVTDKKVKTGSPVAEVEDITLSLSKFDGKSTFPFEASLRVKQGGAIRASGNIDPASPAVEASVAVKDLLLPLAQPYLAQAAPLTLKSGTLSTSGSFNHKQAGGMNYRGEVLISDLEVIENSTSEIMLGWSRLKTPEMRLALNPNALLVDSLDLVGLKTKLIISEGGKVNVVEVFKSGEEPQAQKPTQQEPGNPFPVNIRRVTIDKGLLHFADFSLTPQFETRIHELKGVITGVSSSQGTRTRVSLDGQVDRYGSSTIEGEINFFDPRKFTDISMIFNNIEMANFTPYSGKFVGRKIDGGRLSLDLQYLIEDSRLESRNKIVIDTLILGEKVESPDALNLPLRLAVALLKDSNGIINIGLPITGNLDDPEFSYGQLVWQAITNLITKIISSPFRALGALLGAEDETLDKVLFPAGSSAIPPAEQEKLDNLIKALKERPELKLVVTGRYDTEADGLELRKRQIRQALAEKMALELKPGEDPGPVDFGGTATQAALNELFLERYGRERFEQVLAETEPAPEEDDAEPEEAASPEELARKFFSLLLEEETVQPDALLSLADERAQAVVAHMTGNQGLDTERIDTRPSEGVEEGEPLAVTLDLDAL